MRSVVFLKSAESREGRSLPAGEVGGGAEAPFHFVSNKKKNPFSPP